VAVCVAPAVAAAHAAAATAAARRSVVSRISDGICQQITTDQRPDESRSGARKRTKTPTTLSRRAMTHKHPKSFSD
jgi:hypothetical protein